MKILIGDKGHIDFDEPILMTPEQREKFIEMMKESVFGYSFREYG